MPFEYLPILTANSGPRGPRLPVSPSRTAWTPVPGPLASLRVALLSSSGVRLPDQPPYESPQDTGYRVIPADAPAAGLVTDHRSTAGTDARHDWEIVFPRAALAALVAEGFVGGATPVHFTFMGGTPRHREVEEELGPALAGELRRAGADLAVIIPY
ncbi:MAG TPA: hypothetical protein VHL09_12655 [Dehalococcoidia bacterium]|nr:hypothetical protein [Dehalococcoidia bacterium]